MNKYLKLAIFTIIGAGGGFAYYYYVGCNSGGCPLTSTWYVTTIYGGFMGMVLGIPGKNIENKENKENEENKPGENTLAGH